MLEAVNSVLSNSSYIRVNAEQQSTANSYAANPDRIQKASTQAPYMSQYVKVDSNFDKTILQIRDSSSGDVIRQIPTESQLEAYKRAQTSTELRKVSLQEQLIASDNAIVEKANALQLESSDNVDTVA